MIDSHYNSEEGIVRLAIRGKMDINAAAKLSEALELDHHLANRKSEDKVVFDLQEVDYVASSFIRICVQYAKKLGGNRFSITNCQPFVKKTFKISGLDDLVNIK